MAAISMFYGLVIYLYQFDNIRHHIPLKINAMNPIVTHVKPEHDYSLTLRFSNGETRRFDVKPYLDKGIFQELKDLSKFYSVKPDGLSVEWDNEAALSPDTLYLNSVNI